MKQELKDKRFKMTGSETSQNRMLTIHVSGNVNMSDYI